MTDYVGECRWEGTILDRQIAGPFCQLAYYMEQEDNHVRMTNSGSSYLDQDFFRLGIIELDGFKLEVSPDVV